MTIVACDDLDRLRKFLEAAGLPATDVSGDSHQRFFADMSEDDCVGVVGLELFGKVGLLRSLAVRPDLRIRGAGTRLLTQAETAAASAGVERLYLLTTSAEGFFLRAGYRRTARADAPAPIRTSAEFSTLCPADAAFMMKEIPSARFAG